MEVGKEEMEVQKPTLDEVKHIICWSNAKTPGVDRINIELLKYNDKSLKKSMHRLITNI